MRRRTGVVAKKLGTSRLFRDGVHVPVTVLGLEECLVVGVRTAARHGYFALQVGVGSQAARRLPKSRAGLFFKEGLPVKRKIVEFRVDDEGALLEVGSRILPGHFVEGQYVDVTGLTVGRGFSGVMKRHGFGGLRASHGVSISHRSLGSTGSNQDPGRVWRNKKMPGRCGCLSKTIQNLIVECVDEDLGLLCVRGSVPGSKGGYLSVRDARKKGCLSARTGSPIALPFPALFSDPGSRVGSGSESSVGSLSHGSS